MARRSWLWMLWMVVAACSGGRDEDLSCDDLSPCASGSTCLNGRCVEMSNVVAASADSVGAEVPVLVIDGAGNTCEAQSTCTDLPYGSTVTFRAGSAPGFRFTGWTGSPECTGTAVDLVVPNLTRDTHCLANYVRRVKVSGHTSGGEGGVSASSDGPFASCNGGVCEVDQGQSVKLRADERLGQRFTGWSGAGCGSATTLETTVVAANDLLCVANFVERIVVRANAMNAQTTIEVSSQGAVCEPGSCVLDKGGNATLTAPAVPKFRFAGWSGTSGCVGADPVLRFSALQQSESCLATYRARVTVRGSTSGAEPPPAITALSSDLHASCNGAACDTDVGGGVTLLASSAPGFRLVNWSGAACEAQQGAAVTLSNVASDAMCVANYLQGIAVIGAVVGAPGEVAASSTNPAAVCSAGGCVIDIGSDATLTAPSPAGYRFLGWDGDEGCASTSATVTFSGVSQSKTCYARFAARFLVRGSSAPAEGGSIAASSASPGAVCENGGCTLDGGGEVALTVTAREGFRFSGWSGGGACTGTEPTVRIANVQGNTTCQANFVGRFTVAGVASPASGGSIRASSDSGAASCAGATCQVDRGSRVALTAAPADGFRFVGWSGCSSSTGATLTLEDIGQDLACTASFTPLRYTVASSVAPADSGSVVANATAGNPQCGNGQCTVDWGSAVTLTAAPATGWRFGGWSGCLVSDQATITLPNVRADATCQARFVRITFTVNGAFTPPNGGSLAISATGPGAGCTGLRCTVPYGGGATLIATPAQGWNFGGWSGCSASMSAMLQLANLTGEADCTANFTRQRFDVVGNVDPANGGAVAASSGAAGALCSGERCTVNYGSAVTLRALPGVGFQFVSWAGCSTSANAEIELPNVVANATCTANFQRLTFSVAGSPAPANGGSVSVAAMNAATCNGSACVVQFGGSVTFAAAPATGYDLSGWTGCTPLPADPTRALVANVMGSAICRANFVQRNYRVTGSASAGGSIVDADTANGSCSGAVCTVSHGGSATFTAAADTANGYVLQGWTGCTADPQNPLQATISNVTAVATCRANFVLQRFTVIGNAGPGGAVIAASEGGACSGDRCTVDFGADVTLMAMPLTGFRFTGWSACPVSGGAAIQIPNVSGNVTCTANFTPLTFTVTGAATPAAGGTLSVVSSSNATCTGTSCSVVFGGSVTFQTVDSDAYEFLGWTGCTALPNQPRRAQIASVTANGSCVARYQLRTYQVTGIPGSGGSITTASASPGSCSGSVCTVSHGGSVSFTAAPDTTNGYVFNGWSGACTPSTANPLVASWSGVTQTGTCTVSFIPNLVTVSGEPNNTGGRVVGSAGNFSCTTSSSSVACEVPNGTLVRLSAIEGAGRFDGWSCTNGQTASTTFIDAVAGGNVRCIAAFVPRVTINVALEQPANGTVSITSSDGSPVCNTANTSCRVDRDASITLRATNNFPNDIYFYRWIPNPAVAGAQCGASTTTLVDGVATTTISAGNNYNCIGTYLSILQ